MSCYYNDYDCGCCNEKPQKGCGSTGAYPAIRGSYDTLCELVLAHPIGTRGEAYLVAGELYIWNEKARKWESGGRIVPHSAPFLSSYLEALASAQTIGVNENIVFETAEDYKDIVGVGISMSADGRVFTITKPGLYHVEWSLNLASGDQPVTIGLSEQGQPNSALSSANGIGGHSSGALITVAKGETYTISLHNYGRALTITNPTGYEGTAGSIRIARFADGPLKA